MTTYHQDGRVTIGWMHRWPFRVLTDALTFEFARDPVPSPEANWDAGLWWPHVARLYPILMMLVVWALLMGFVVGIGLVLLTS